MTKNTQLQEFRCYFFRLTLQSFHYRSMGRGKGGGRDRVSLSRVGTRGFLWRRGLDRVTKYCVLIGPRPS